MGRIPKKYLKLLHQNSISSLRLSDVNLLTNSTSRHGKKSIIKYFCSIWEVTMERKNFFSTGIYFHAFSLCWITFSAHTCNSRELKNIPFKIKPWKYNKKDRMFIAVKLQVNYWLLLQIKYDRTDCIRPYSTEKRVMCWLITSLVWPPASVFDCTH